jgi:hypothetical protein
MMRFEHGNLRRCGQQLPHFSEYGIYGQGLPLPLDKVWLDGAILLLQLNRNSLRGANN